jgi:hypothetical protein
MGLLSNLFSGSSKKAGDDVLLLAVNAPEPSRS